MKLKEKEERFDMLVTEKLESIRGSMVSEDEHEALRETLVEAAVKYEEIEEEKENFLIP